MRVAIIGAGPAGMTAAYLLARGGASVDVFEASDAIGGLARSLDLWGQRVDLGPHRFFSRDRRVNQLWLEVVGNDYAIVDRMTRIYYQKRFFNYPLTPGNALWNMGVLNAGACALSYFKEQVRPSFRLDNRQDAEDAKSTNCKEQIRPSLGEGDSPRFASRTAQKGDSPRRFSEEDQTFESWVVRRFGRKLFNMFFKSYSEKLWGFPCNELDADFAAQRIRKLSLWGAIKGAFGLGNGNHKTLADQFAYPLGGTGSVYETMARHVAEDGGRVHLKTPVSKVLHQNRKVHGVELADGTRESFDCVISTMPLTLLVKGLGENRRGLSPFVRAQSERMVADFGELSRTEQKGTVPLSAGGDLPADVQAGVDALKFRNTILIYLNVASSDLFKDQWLYVHSPELGMGRVTNFRNWVPELFGDSPNSILALEYWCYDEDAIWSEPDEQLIDRAKAETRATGLSAAAEIIAGKVVRIRRCYPVYRRDYKKHLAPVVAFLKTFDGLIPIGRYGAFKYNNQDHSILMGLLAAENLLLGTSHDLWSVNSDYESYQEAAIITKTGLQPLPK